MEKGRIDLEEFLEKFPPEDYIQVLPSLILKDSLPPYLSFAIEVVRVDPEDPLQAYPPPGSKGKKALSGAIWETIGTALGLKWIPDLCRRMDSGKIREYCHFQSGAVLSNLTGMVPIVCNYDFNTVIYGEQERLRLEKYPPEWSTWKISDVRPDLFTKEKKDRNAKVRELSPELQDKFMEIKVRENVLQKEQYLLRLCESGSRLRVIRKVTGLPHVFDPGVLKRKAFAVLKVIIRIYPETEAERIDINRRLMAQAYPAYGMPAPSSGAVEIGPGSSPPLALESGDEIRDIPKEGPGPSEAQYTEIDIDETPDAAEEEAAGTAAPVPDPQSGASSTLPDSDIPEPEKSKAGKESGKEEFIREVGEILIELKELIGQEEAKIAVGGLLSERKVHKLREVLKADQRGFISALKIRLDNEIKIANTAAASDPPGSDASAENSAKISRPSGKVPDAPFWAGSNYAGIMDITARRVKKTPDAELRDGINRMIDEAKYDVETDPIALTAIMGVRQGKSVREGLDEAYMRLIEYTIIHARRG